MLWFRGGRADSSSRRSSDHGTKFTTSLLAALCNLLNTQNAQTTVYYPQSNSLVGAFIVASKTHSGPASLQTTGQITCLGCCWASAQVVFGSPLILPGQFLDSPEFLPQFSQTLRADKHSSSRHNTAAARQPTPKLPDTLTSALTVFIWHNGHVLPLQQLYDGPYTILWRFCTTSPCRLATRQTRCQHSNWRTAVKPVKPIPSGPHPCPLPGFSVTRYILPALHKVTCAGNFFPLVSRQEVCTPHHHSSSNSSPASTQLKGTK